MRSRTGTIVNWEAPLPPPALLEQYDKVVPGLAGDIAKRAQVEADHVRELDTAALNAAISYRTRGQWMGFGAVLGILGVSALALVTGSPWVAGIALTVVVSTAAVFILRSRRKTDEKERREERSLPPGR